MKNFSYGTLFSGGGLMDFAIDAVGGEGKWAVEMDTKASAHFALNHPAHKVFNCKIQDVNPNELEAVDALHISPPCQEASTANSKGKESSVAIEAAIASVNIIRNLHARGLKYITLENVWGYRKFKAFHLILGALKALGYVVGYQQLNAADFGTPQNRKRLWLRAVLPEYCTVAYQPSLWDAGELLPISGNAERVGWYEALKDIIPSLPDDKLADWQIKRLPARLRKPFMVYGANSKSNGKRYMLKDESSCTLTSDALAMRVVSGFLTEGKNYRANSLCTTADLEEPAMTCITDARMKAVLIDGGTNDRGMSMTSVEGGSPSFCCSASQYKRPTKAILLERDGAGASSHPRNPDSPSPTIRALGGDNHCHQLDVVVGATVKRLTPDALWLLQMYGCDLEYKWLPDTSNAVKCRIIGNGVAYLNAKAVWESLINKKGN